MAFSVMKEASTNLNDQLYFSTSGMVHQSLAVAVWMKVEVQVINEL